jgi:hypothetical protein
MMLVRSRQGVVAVEVPSRRDGCIKTDDRFRLFDEESDATTLESKPDHQVERLRCLMRLLRQGGRGYLAAGRVSKSRRDRAFRDTGSDRFALSVRRRSIRMGFV